MEGGDAVVIIATPSDGRAESAALPVASTWINPVLSVRYLGRVGRLLIRRRPSAVGKAWLRYDDDCQLAEVDLGEVELVALMEG